MKSNYISKHVRNGSDLVSTILILFIYKKYQSNGIHYDSKTDYYWTSLSFNHLYHQLSSKFNNYDDMFKLINNYYGVKTSHDKNGKHILMFKKDILDVSVKFFSNRKK